MIKVRAQAMIFPLLVLASCKPQTMDECLAEAANNAKSVAALETLKGVCERKHAKERLVITDVGDVDDVILTTPYQFMFEGLHSLSITRSSMERTELGIKAAVVDLQPPSELPEIRPFFDSSGSYNSVAESQLEKRGIKEFDCKNSRERWLNVDTKLYIGSRGEPVAVLDMNPEYRAQLEDALRDWRFISDSENSLDFQYVCEGQISPELVSFGMYKNICGKSYKGKCVPKARFKRPKWKE